MITLAQTSLLYELRRKPIPRATLAELEFQLQERIHSMILDAFNKSGLSQKELAERLGWDTARVSRCLGLTGNLTLKTISALLAAIGVDLDDPSYTSFDELEHVLRAEDNPHQSMLETSKLNPCKDFGQSMMKVPNNRRQVGSWNKNFDAQPPKPKSTPRSFLQEPQIDPGGRSDFLRPLVPEEHHAG